MNAYFAAALAAMLLGLGIGSWIDHSIMGSRLDALKTADAEAQTKAVGLARSHELGATNDLTAINNQLESDNEALKSNNALLNQRVDTGTLQLSIPAKCPRTVPDHPAIVGQPEPETRADLLPGSAKWLAGLAIRCDSDVRDRNAAIDSYNAIRDRYNPKP